MELREAAIELQDENYELKQKIKELEAELATKQEVVWEKPSYWLIKDKVKDGPFCQICYDVDNKLVRLQGGKNDFWKCNSCKSSYRGPTYVKPDLRIPNRRDRI